MWHLVCGDNAVAGVTHVIGKAVAATALRVLRDDLAVGPLADVGSIALSDSQAALFTQFVPRSLMLDEIEGVVRGSAR